jgi:hypothetical protein
LLGDPQLASWARIALEAIPGSAIDDALRKSAEPRAGDLLVGAINSIGYRRRVRVGGRATLGKQESGGNGGGLR